MTDQQNNANRRGTFRRYSDRRVAALLELYEILYHEPPGAKRNQNLLNTMSIDYQVDRAALVTPRAENERTLTFVSLHGDWGDA